jgi:virulence-associated protein VagC
MPRTAKVFMTNRSQAVRLPKEFQPSVDTQNRQLIDTAKPAIS